MLTIVAFLVILSVGIWIANQRSKNQQISDHVDRVLLNWSNKASETERYDQFIDGIVDHLKDRI